MGSLGSRSPFSQNAFDILEMSDLPAMPFIRPGGAARSLGTTVAYKDPAKLVKSLEQTHLEH